MELGALSPESKKDKLYMPKYFTLWKITPQLKLMQIIKKLLFCQVLLVVMFSSVLAETREKYIMLHLYFDPPYIIRETRPTSLEGLIEMHYSEVFIKNPNIIQDVSGLIAEFTDKHEKNEGVEGAAILVMYCSRPDGKSDLLYIDWNGQFEFNSIKGKMTEQQLTKVIKIMERVTDIYDVKFKARN